MKSVLFIGFLACLAVQGFAPAKAQQRPVQAHGGSLAIGGSVSGGNINVGISTEQLEALVRDRTHLLEKYSTSLERELDLNQRQVRAALTIVGQANVPPEQLAAKLVEVAQRFKELQSVVSARPGDDPKVASLKADAAKAIEAGELAKADELLAAAENPEATALDRLAFKAAETSAQRGEVALTRLRYREAAQHFANAASRVPSGQDDKRLSYLRREAGSLYRQGDELGDNIAAQAAIERCRRILALTQREHVPLQWAEIQNDLGMALFKLGERESGTQRLEEAALAFRLALFERTRDRVPLDWAATQGNLGTVLARLGERKGGTEQLEEAAHALRLALEEMDPGRAPLDWATGQNNLGLTLTMLGEREGGTRRLEEAAQAFRLALVERSRGRVPLDWAATQLNLGTVLARLGERESGTQRLEESVQAFRLALEELTRARTPLHWATVQNNIGVLLRMLGEREGKVERLEEAAQALRLALEERSRDRVPLYWAATQVNLGGVLARLGERESGTQRLEESVQASRLALEELTRARIPLYWATVQNNLGIALTMLGERESGTQRLEEAIHAFRLALEERTRERSLLDWAVSTGQQGVALALLAARSKNMSVADRAVRQLEATLSVLRNAGHAPGIEIYEGQFAKARTIHDRLKDLRDPARFSSTLKLDREGGP